jgi:hypothetical protein
MLMELLSKAATVAMLSFVVSSMLAMGAGLTVSQISEPLRNEEIRRFSCFGNNRIRTGFDANLSCASSPLRESKFRRALSQILFQQYRLIADLTRTPAARVRKNVWAIVLTCAGNTVERSEIPFRGVCLGMPSASPHAAQ